MFIDELNELVGEIQKSYPNITGVTPTLTSNSTGIKERGLKVHYGSCGKVIPWRDLASFSKKPFCGFDKLYEPYNNGDTAWIDGMSKLELVQQELTFAGFYPVIEMLYTTNMFQYPCTYYMYVHPTGVVVFLEDYRGELGVCRYIIASEDGIHSEALAVLQMGNVIDTEVDGDKTVSVVGRYVTRREEKDVYTMDLFRKAHTLDSADWNKHENSELEDYNGDLQYIVAAGTKLFVKHGGITFYNDV